jgi:hypothetical protein
VVDKSLAGDGLDESKNSRMPSMRLSESIQGWNAIHKFWRDSALLVSRLWLSLFKVVAILCIFSTFLFLSHVYWKLSWRRRLEDL